MTIRLVMYSVSVVIKSGMGGQVGAESAIIGQHHAVGEIAVALNARGVVGEGEGDESCDKRTQ